MDEAEIIKLQTKIEELKSKYETAKNNRIELVKSIEDLDKKLSELEVELKQARLKYNNNHIDKMKQSRNLKRAIVRTILAFLVSMIIITGIDILVFKDLTLLISQWQSTLFINVMSNMSPFIVSKIINLKNKNKYRNYSEIENEYKKILEQRLTKGQEYKKTREEEVISEKIYKRVEPILLEEITRITMNIQKESQISNIDMKDIYYKIKVDSSFDSETIDNKKIILDELSKKYLASKISEIYYKAIKPEDLEILSAEELVKILMNETPKSQHNEILQHLIHAVINFSGNLQGYSIIWYEEKEQSLINNPEIVFDEQGKWTELKTHKNTNYQILFNIVYDTFLNKVMKKQTSKTKIRQ